MKKKANLIDDIWTRQSERILETMGNHIIGLPAVMWKKNMFLMGIRNDWWKERTGSFPARSRSSGTHPLFVISSSTVGSHVCPCSSRKHSGRFIRQGCLLKKTGKRMDRDSYILEKFSFPVPRSLHLIRKPGLYGIVPQTCLAGRDG
jgi:hypothetical protein